VTDGETEIAEPSPSAADAVADLWVALARGQRAHDSHLLAEPNRTRVRERLARYAATGQLLVARSSGGERRIVGFVMFVTRTDQYEVDRQRGLVENLYVVPDRRGEGIGSALLARAERRLREAGADIVSLEAMADNEAARRFYRRHGYEPHRVKLEKQTDAED
jgi:ribosomal protein S18 acetylase RimI-like enzyme